MATRPHTACPSRRLFPRAVLVLVLAFVSGAHAAEQQGLVTATGVPVPGATVTATHGDKKIATATDANGRYSIADIEDGTWMLRIEMPGFQPVTREVTVAPGAEPQTFELSLMPFAEITKGIEIPPPAPTPSPSATQNAARNNTPAQNRSATPAPSPAPF